MFHIFQWSFPYQNFGLLLKLPRNNCIRNAKQANQWLVEGPRVIVFVWRIFLPSSFMKRKSNRLIRSSLSHLNRPIFEPNLKWIGIMRKKANIQVSVKIMKNTRFLNTKLSFHKTLSTNKTLEELKIQFYSDLNHQFFSS